MLKSSYHHMSRLAPIALAIGLSACASINTNHQIDNSTASMMDNLILVTREKDNITSNSLTTPTGETIIPSTQSELIQLHTKDGLIIQTRNDSPFYDANKPQESLLTYYNLKGNIVGRSDDLREWIRNSVYQSRYVIQPRKYYFEQYAQLANELKQWHALPQNNASYGIPTDIDEKLKNILYRLKSPAGQATDMVLYDHQTKIEISLAGTNICSDWPEIEIRKDDGIALISAKDCQSQLYGFIDPTLTWVVPPQFDYLRFYFDKHQPKKTSKTDKIVIALGAIHMESDNLFSSCQRLILSDGTVSAPRIFDTPTQDAQFFLARACSTNEQNHDGDAIIPNGIANQLGQWVLPPQSGRHLQSLPDEQGHVSFLDIKSQTMGSMDIHGNIIFPAQFFAIVKENLSTFDNDIHPIVYDTQGLAAVSANQHNTHYGFINRKGEWQIHPNLIIGPMNSYGFDEIGRAYANTKNNKILRIIDIHGNDMYPSIQGSFGKMSASGFMAFQPLKTSRTSKPQPSITQALMNEKGEQLTPPIYHSIQFLPRQLAIVSIQHPVTNGTAPSETHGVVNMQGQWVIPAQYDVIQAYRDYLIVRKNGQYGILNYQNQWLYPLQNHVLRPFFQKNNE